MECWQNERKGTLKVPFCEAIVILLTVLCLTINKIARCSLQAWEQSVIWERGLLRVWVFVWGVMPVKYCLVSCVPLPPLSSCQPLSRYTSCAGLLQKKIKSYLSECSHQLQAIIVKTEPLYVGPWQAMFGDYVVASWYLFRPGHHKWPQVSSLFLGWQFPSVGAEEEEAILIPSSPLRISTWPSVGNKTSIPSTLFRYDLAWRGGLARKKCHPLFYNPRNRQFVEQSVIPVDQDGTTEGQSWTWLVFADIGRIDLIYANNRIKIYTGLSILFRCPFEIFIWASLPANDCNISC